MAASVPTLFICSCERTMPLAPASAGDAISARVNEGHQFCGAELDRVRTALGKPGEVVIACTAQAPLFTEVSEELGRETPPTYVNIREMAGWSDQASSAGPKMAALIAAAAESMPPISFVTLESKGVALIYGRDDTAIEAGRKLADRLDITVILSGPGDVPPPRTNEFPVFRGRIRSAKGHLGKFELTVDDFAIPAPSSRSRLEFGAARNGAVSHCDIVLDISGGTPLFPASDLRPGYLRADPANPAALERAINQAGGLAGTFDKPRYVNFDASLCAHSRSGITGCTRCLDLCPTGAILPAGDAVAIDPAICAGCGQCAASCPTGAVSYALPPADALMRRLRALMQAYRAAGGSNAHILFHDGEHGEELIEALARFGAGLPANVLPLRVNEVTQVGPEAIAALFAHGATNVSLLARAKPKHDMLGTQRIVDACNRIVAGLGFGDGLVRVIETDDPDALRASLDGAAAGKAAKSPASFIARGGKRGVMETALRELHRVAPAPVASIALDKGAPFGGVTLDTQGCTLCLSCVTACPSGALSDNPDKPMLRFTESLCVQCGLCQSTCPEKVISIEPRVDFDAWNAGTIVLKEEEPFPCISCGKPFGARSSVERVIAKLESKHWMFSGANAHRLDIVKMCEDCRVEKAVNESFDPHAAPQRPPVMTSEDYLRARAQNKKPLGDEPAS
jgi:ferredoxin